MRRERWAVRAAESEGEGNDVRRDVSCKNNLERTSWVLSRHKTKSGRI